MECPKGFFCFDKTTIILIIIALIILVVHYIKNTNNQIYNLSNKINDNKNIIDSKINKINHVNQQKDAINKYWNDEKEYITEKDHQRIFNPLMPPERSYPFRISRLGVPVNIPTRGQATGYQQVGVLIEETNKDNKRMLPLFGEQTYPGSRQWKYYTSSDGYQSVKLPIYNKNRNCQDRFGCDEIWDGNLVNVKGYNEHFKATIYKQDAPIYLPHVI